MIQTSIELVLPIRIHRRRVGIYRRAEVAERDERSGFAGVLESQAVFRAVLGAFVEVQGTGKGSIHPQPEVFHIHAIGTTRRSKSFMAR